MVMHTKNTKENFKVEKNRVVGINNPVYSVILDKNVEDANFEVYGDGELLESTIQPLPVIDKTVIEAKLGKVKVATLIYVKDGEKYQLAEKKSVLFNRILEKIRSILWTLIIKIKVSFIVLGRGIRFLWREHHFLVPFGLWKKYFNRFFKRVHEGTVPIHYNPFVQADYLKWLEENEKEISYEQFEYNPLISVLIPVYNIDKKLLSECVESVLKQSYVNFEICLVDDASTKQETIKLLKSYQENNPKIKVKFREVNGHISAATNDALEMAEGEFIALVDNDDVLDKDALYHNVKAINKDKKIDFLYSDEDKIDPKGRRCDPNFKPNYSPDTLLSLNYICHLAVIRKSIVQQVGGFTLGLEGSQDYDLFLKISEVTSKIHHIPEILYHWRMVEGSTSMAMENKGYAMEKSKLALEAALKRRGLNGKVEKDLASTYYRVTYQLDTEPLISIIIPAKDHADVTEICLKSLYEKTTYKNFEVILVDNNSSEQVTFDMFKKYENKYDNFKVIKADMEFNYSKINNLAIDQANGEVIVLLNNDTEVISGDWLSVMIGYAMQPHIGAVGPKLLYPDTTVQHGGVIMGLGGVASHAYLGSAREDLGMYGRLSVPYNYSGVTAACLMVEKKKALEVGKLEEDLKVAYNDIDFDLKLLEAGYYNLFIPQIELFHYESKSRGLDTTGEKYKRFLIESKYMFTKWKDVLENDSFYNPNFSKKGWFVLDKLNTSDRKRKKS